MKKILLVLMLAFLLVSCNNKDVEKKKPEDKKTEEILKTEIREDINPNIESEINV